MFMEIRFATETSVYIKKINEKEAWLKVSEGKVSGIKDAAYISGGKFKALSRDYGFLVEENGSFPEALKDNFINDAKGENLQKEGGMVIYFAPFRGRYMIWHSSIVKKIEKTD